MSRPNYLAAIATTSSIAFAAGIATVQPGQATNLVSITCQQQESVPTVIAILSNQDVSQATPLLSFLPQYFEAAQASQYCQSAAAKLQTYYSQERMNYLASDTIAGKPVVCAVERRGLSCDSYSSDILFSLSQAVSPTELLYNMLGSEFKGSKAPSSRTVSRIYTDLRPLWWPF
ncbi:MAG: COP23 domain-containing protein [Cyanobacteria bacterium P01_C01_bin.72]